MGTKYEDKFVKCPYYRRHENNKIACEGIRQGNTINLVFEQQADKRLHMHEYCYSIFGCRDCIVHIALNMKYEEDEADE